MATQIKPIEKEIELPDGSKKTFIISKFDAISGREIVSQYPISGMPKLGDYKTNEELMLKMMKFVAVKAGDEVILLETRALVNNHAEDWEVLAKVEISMMEYNCSFFAQGKASNFLDNLAKKLPKLISSMLMDLSGQLSQNKKQH